MSYEGDHSTSTLQVGPSWIQLLKQAWAHMHGEEIILGFQDLHIIQEVGASPQDAHLVYWYPTTNGQRGSNDPIQPMITHTALGCM